MFDIHSLKLDPRGDNEDRLHRFGIRMLEAFGDSPEGREFEESTNEIQWVALLVDLLAVYLETTPAKATPEDVLHVLHYWIPRKVSVDPDQAYDIVEELRAFWKYAGREFGLKHAPAIVRELNDEAAEKLEEELSNPENFGMAKSLFTMAESAGFDTTTEEGVQELVTALNSGQIGRDFDRLIGVGFPDDEFDDADEDDHLPMTRGPDRVRRELVFAPKTPQERKARQKALERAKRKRR